MIITDHYVDGEWVGMTLPHPAEKVIEVWQSVLTEYDKDILVLKDYHITFNTLEGEVEYLLSSVEPIENKYKFILIEDRRDVR